MMMWSLLYGIIALFCCWVFTRFIRWQISRWVKAKFDVDTAIRSIGLFSIYDITIRLNQLQTIEIDKVSLKLKFFSRNASSRVVSLHIGEVRVRGEIRTTSLSSTSDGSSTGTRAHRRTASASKPYNKLVNLLPAFFKYVSVHTDMLNIMVLHALVPDSLLHVNICGIHLASSKSIVADREGENHAVTGSLTLQTVEGKILKTPKEASEVTSCIAEISTSIELAILAKRLQPSVELDTVNLDLSKLQIDLHEGALIPGILLPQIKPEHFNRSSREALTIEQLEHKLLKVIDILPTNTILCIRSFGLAFFGDETMGETIRGANVCSRKIMFRQFKDTTNMVPVIMETSRNELKVPSGNIRLTVEDVAMTDYYKHKVADMGKTVFESKLTANGVLSNSFDFTSWHADYMHKESVEFWSIILNKIQDAQQQKAIVRQALYYFPPQDSDKDSRGTRMRAASTPETSNYLSHPDILQGTEDAGYPGRIRTPTDSLSISELLKLVEIGVVLECTVYDASINMVMSSVGEDVDDDPPSFTICLHSFTGSMDQSPHSRDFSFMAKTENFNCMVSQEGSPLPGLQSDATHESNSNYKTGVHHWGRAFNIEGLGVHGSASFKPLQDSDNDAQEISFLIDAKVDGVQVEVSKRAAEALSSVLCTINLRSDGRHNRPPYQRQATTPLNYVDSPQGHRMEVKKHRYSLACLELELLRVNGFILSSDETSCADCLVARFDQVKVEVSGEGDDVNDDFIAEVTRKLSVIGVAISTVHNPTFSAFASYEGGLNGARTPAAKLPPSMRLQQTRAAEHMCVESVNMVHSHMAFALLEVCYSAKFNNNNCEAERRIPENIKEAICHNLSVTLTADSDIVVRWTPSLHALIHYEITDFVSTLSPFFKRSKLKHQQQPNTSFHNLSKRQEHVSNHGDHNISQKNLKDPIKVKMFGDGVSTSTPASPRPVVLDINVSAVLLHFCVSDQQNVKFYLSPLRCIQSRDDTNISFDEFNIVMDESVIFAFSNVVVELSRSNEICNKDRRLFSDLITETNRAWSFNVASLKCFFPHKYDFAATFDQSVTTFKWVKGLYRKTSHPFRSPRLPPDLLIHISQFTFEIGDWEFESHLRDNHELMKDEWSESEKRRRVLDQRMAELRKTKGELLPAKKVEELYCQLAATNINIYLLRSRKMYTRASCPVLMTWTVNNFNLTALADASMHGMDNAIRTIRTIDDVSPFPFKRDQDDDPDFVTLWCRCICLHAERHQVRVRNYPQCLMDYSDWKVQGKFCGAEQKGPVTAQRTEYVHLPLPWEPAAVKRNMPALKFYHDLKSQVHTFNMAWGPCWDPAWAQVNLAFNLLTKTTVDPSPQLTWWDKSRMLFHGRLAMVMDRVNLLHLASLDPYNTTEHMHWDWKNLTMDWLPGRFIFKGDLDIHIRNASKYDDIRFLHLPSLIMDVSFDWICLDGADPHNHHLAIPFSPDHVDVVRVSRFVPQLKIYIKRTGRQGSQSSYPPSASDLPTHDSYSSFRSRSIDLSISLDTTTADEATDDKPEILLYSTTLRWLGNFWYAVNAVTRPISKGAIFGNVIPPKLKLSRHYRNVKLSFHFPKLKACYWSSYTQQLGLELICGAGKVSSHFRLRIVPFEGKLIRRSMGEWSVVSTNFDVKNAKIYLLKRQEIENLVQSPSTRSLGVEKNFVLSLSKMSYHRSSVNEDGGKRATSKVGIQRAENPTSSETNEFGQTKQWKKRQKKVSSPTKKPQNSQTLVVHDLRAMWTTDNRDVGYGLYEGYSKAAVMRRNLSTKILSKFRVGTNRGEDAIDGGASGRKLSQVTPNSDTSPSLGISQKTMDPSEMLHQLLSESANKLVGAEDPTTEQQQLKGVAASSMDDVANENWLIKFVNCQAMLKGPKTQGYIIMTAAQADFFNRDHKVAWRDGQLTTKSSWIGSLVGTQVFATVEKNVTSSGQDGENVPWLSVSDIAPRGPSPGMLDISDLMGGGQAIGGVVGDGVSAGSFQLQRIVSRCTCRMFYVGYEALVDSEKSDYAHLLPETPMSPEEDKSQLPKVKSSRGSLLGNEKAMNVLTISQPELEICTNTSQFTMIIDIVENLLLYVEPVMREHWERVDRMRFKLRLTSADDAAKHKDTLAAMQSRIRTQLTNMRQLERQLYRIDRALDKDPDNLDLLDETASLRQRLAEDKETLNIHSEELGIIIRCFKEMFLEQKTRTSSLRPQNQESSGEEDEASVVRTTEVSLGRVKWHLTDADGQLNIAQFEMKDFLYEKVNRSDESVSHCFELAWLCLQNLLPNSLYRDVLKPRHEAGLRTHGVSGAGGRSLTLRVLCKVRPPVGGISVKDHVEVNTVPLTIQLTFQFFKRMMSFFFPNKGITSSVEEEDGGSQDNRGATLLGLPSSNLPQDRYGSLLSLPSRPPPSPSSSHSQLSTPGSLRKGRSSTKRDRSLMDAFDDVDKMKERAAKNNSFLYIKITQVPLCVSYKGEKEKNMEDVHEFDVAIPMLEYHSVTWTWHDFAMAVKRDCKKQLLSQLIKKKLHIIERSSSHASAGSATEQAESSQAAENTKAKLLLGNTLQRSDSRKKSLLFRKKK